MCWRQISGNKRLKLKRTMKLLQQKKCIKNLKKNKIKSENKLLISLTDKKLILNSLEFVACMSEC